MINKIDCQNVTNKTYVGKTFNKKKRIFIENCKKNKIIIMRLIIGKFFINYKNYTYIRHHMK